MIAHELVRPCDPPKDSRRSARASSPLAQAVRAADDEDVRGMDASASLASCCAKLLAVHELAGRVETDDAAPWSMQPDKRPVLLGDAILGARAARDSAISLTVKPRRPSRAPALARALQISVAKLALGPGLQPADRKRAQSSIRRQACARRSEYGSAAHIFSML